jgi:hypothetical protein
VKKHFLAVSLGTIVLSTLLLFSCRKINESTSLGDDLIPPIDNINTFDTLLDVLVFNDTFSLATDSSTYTPAYNHYVGMISNDPFFGKTDARFYLQLKPNFFPFTFSGRPDSLHLDSIVLVLNYADVYGDTTADQTVNVYEIAQSSAFSDTISNNDGYLLRKNDISYAGLLGSRSFKPLILNDSVKAYKDTTVGQLRIRLDDAFGQRILAYDTAAGQAFRSDSLFDTFFKGFALESTSGNALMGFSLSAANTKLAIYYRDDNGDAPVAKWDTLVNYMSFTALSASAQFVKRDYSGTPVEAAAGVNTPANIVYLQGTPGTFATVRIPGLPALNNRIVHRAELIMEQLYDVSDSTFQVPGGLYLDAYDANITPAGYRTIPYDMLFDANSNPNHSVFGVYPFRAKDPMGNSINVWRFNMTRYVQHLVNDTEPYYDLRLTAPLYLEDYFRLGGPSSTSTKVPIAVNTAAGKGRVRLHGGGDGSQPNPNPQRMRLRIVYSKI